jgi:hypothetical protein
MPAKAGIQPRFSMVKSLDFRLRGNDDKGVFSAFYETHQNHFLAMGERNADI